jgi:hypothetical protein
MELTHDDVEHCTILYVLHCILFYIIIIILFILWLLYLDFWVFRTHVSSCVHSRINHPYSVLIIVRCDNLYMLYLMDKTWWTILVIKAKRTESECTWQRQKKGNKIRQLLQRFAEENYDKLNWIYTITYKRFNNDFKVLLITVL